VEGRELQQIPAGELAALSTEAVCWLRRPCLRVSPLRAHAWLLLLPLLQDTDAAGVVPEHQQVVLTYQGAGEAGGNVATGDEPPVVLGR
jgi:hypothetical protein